MLAQEWFYGLMIRPDMSIKVKRKLHNMRIPGRIIQYKIKSRDPIPGFYPVPNCKKWQKEKSVSFQTAQKISCAASFSYFFQVRRIFAIRFPSISSTDPESYLLRFRL